MGRSVYICHYKIKPDCIFAAWLLALHSAFDTGIETISG